MSERDDKDMLAAEFVLGSLDRDERDRVRRQRRRDSELEQRIGEWEARLAPLADEIEDLAPGPDLLPLIQQRIKAIEDAAGGAKASTSPRAAGVTPLHRRLVLVEGRHRPVQRRGGHPGGGAAGTAVAVHQ